jgi:hypothetical protein
MRAKGAIAFMLILTGLVGYLLFDAIGIGGGVLTAGILSAGFFLKQPRCSRIVEGRFGYKQIGCCAEFMNRLGRRRSPCATRASAQRARLEALRAKAYFLVGNCHDTYGAQQCCLEIISQTEKEDPLFIEACDLYMRMANAHPCPMHAARPPLPANPLQIGARPVPAATKVIPFPRSDDRI